MNKEDKEEISGSEYIDGKAGVAEPTDWCQCAEFMPIPDPKVCAKCHKPIYYMAWPASQSEGMVLRCHKCRSTMLFKCLGDEVEVYHDCPDVKRDGEREGKKDAYSFCARFMTTNPAPSWAAREFEAQAASAAPQGNVIDLPSMVKQPTPRCESGEAVSLERHLIEVKNFLNEMYCTLIDPTFQGPIKVADMCAQLIEAARANREALQNTKAGVAEPHILRCHTCKGMMLFRPVTPDAKELAVYHECPKTSDWKEAIDQIDEVITNCEQSNESDLSVTLGKVATIIASVRKEQP